MTYEFPPAVLDCLGCFGVALYLGSYGLLQAAIIRGGSYVYALLNLAASCLLLASFMVSFNLSSALIQVSWIAIGIVGLIRLALVSGSVHFSAKEYAFFKAVFPDMPKSVARRMTKQGNWISVGEDAAIATEGKAVNHLFFLHDGKARVLSVGVAVGRPSNGLVAEMNVVQEGAASSTVKTGKNCQYFMISSDVLNWLCARGAEIRMLVDDGMCCGTGRKLSSANRKFSKEVSLIEP